MNRGKLAVQLGLATIALLAPLTMQAQPIKSIVLVHGAWVDGSGWKPVYEKLIADGYQVTIVQEPLTSFADDVQAVHRALNRQSGPCILVSHSYGGSLITQAGLDRHVAALVYVASHMPDAGESEAADGKLYPGAASQANVVVKTPDGYTFLRPDAFPTFFAADLPLAQANFEAASQILTAASVFNGTITTAAWRTKPTWVIIAGSDKIINPDLERWYAKRANSHVIEVAGASHSVYESRPKEVVAAIEDAAQHAQP